MRFTRNPQLWPSEKCEDERRRHGRLRTDEVACSIGEVVDMSASGMRVVRRGRQPVAVGDTFTVTIKCGQFALPVDVSVVRIEKLGFLRYSYGLHFEEVNPDIQRKLSDLAKIAADQRVIAGQMDAALHPHTA